MKKPIPTPFWNTSVTAPYAAPTDSRFIRIALIGTTIERNTTIRSRNDRPSTNANTIHWYESVTSRKSRKIAEFPPTNTSTPGTSPNAAGTAWSRSCSIAPNDASFCVSPLKNADTFTADPSSVVATCVADENAGFCGDLVLQLRMPACASAEVTSPVDHDLRRVGEPAGELALQDVMNAAFAGTSGSWLMFVELPLFSWK